MIYHVPISEVPGVWPMVAPLLEKALARSNGTYEAEDIYERLMDNRQQLLVAVIDEKIVAAFISEVVDYPRKRAIRLAFGAGSHLHEWGPLLNDVMEIGAEAVGADLIEVHGRMGWMRYLKSLCGAKTETVLMTRKVK